MIKISQLLSKAVLAKAPKAFAKRMSYTIDEIALLMMPDNLKAGRSTSRESQLKNPAYSTVLEEHLLPPSSSLIPSAFRGREALEERIKWL